MIKDLKFDLIVSEVKRVEKLDKENLYTITMIGSVRLIPDSQGVEFSEAAAVKLIISDVEQRTILQNHGFGDKGDMKEIVIRGSPQKRLESYSEDEVDE